MLTRLLHALRPDGAGGGGHPALVLSECDAVLDAIAAEDAQKAFLPALFGASDLAKALRPAVDRQWAPILVDTRAALSRTAAVLLLLGATVVFGRLIMLLPVMRTGQEVLTVLGKVNPERAAGRVHLQGGHGGGGSRGGGASLDAADALRLAKALGMLYAASMLLSTMALYAAAGHAALVGGTVMLLGASSESAMKKAAPTLAPIAAPIAALAARALTLVESEPASACDTAPAESAGGAKIPRPVY